MWQTHVTMGRGIIDVKYDNKRGLSLQKNRNWTQYDLV